MRAMVANLARSGRPQGGSTITQQVVKNLLVGDDVTYERKMREMILATRLEQVLTKQEILELYLNSIYLGRGSYGIELAARNYFGKSASALTLQEAAMLAGMPKGPTYYSPDRHPERAQERLSYVVARLQEDGDAGNLDPNKVTLPPMIAYERPQQRDSGYYFLDNVTREARSLPSVGPLTSAASTVHTTLRPDLQRVAEEALQEGLAQYEMHTGRTEWHGAEANLADAVRRIEDGAALGAAAAIMTTPADPTSEVKPSQAPAPRTAGAGKAKAEVKSEGPKPAWQRALAAAHLPLYDVHWTTAIVLSTGGDRGIRVGLADGTVLPLNGAGSAVRRGLRLYDVVFVKVSNAKSRQARAELRVRPTVEGAVVILDNKTGGILAMVGGFSYPLSQLNRVTQTQRQPGSTLKPFTYLAALRSGLQPNTLVKDERLTLPPIDRSARVRERDYWSPKNYDGTGGGITTLRRGLENSKNLVTAHLLDGGIETEPSQSLARVCELTLDAQIYRDCVAYYPFVLGAQPARLIDLAGFYASMSSEGHRPTPYSIASIEQNGRTVYTHVPDLKWLAAGDRPAFFQLRTMLQGVVARGTAHAIGQLAPYVGGKTGTSEDQNDAWFIGFTNDVTVGVWVGYDNSEGKRRTLGEGQTGAQVALPIFIPIIDSVWANYAPKTPLAPPSPEATKELVALPINLRTGNLLAGRNPQGFTEYFRLRNGRLEETQYTLVSADEAASSGDADDDDVVTREPRGRGTRPAYGGGFFQGGGLFGGLFRPPQAQVRPNYPTSSANGGGYYALPQVQRPVYPSSGGYYYGTPQSQAQRPVYPPAAVPNGGYYGEARPNYSEERRWVPLRRYDPDVPWRDRQRD